MLDKMEQTLNWELMSDYENSGKKQIFSEQSFLSFLKHIKKHRYFYKINLRTRTSFPLKQGYEGLWEMIEPLCRRAGITEEEKIMYYFINFQAGFTMTLKHWVDTDCRMEEKEVAHIIKSCVPHVLSASVLETPRDHTDSASAQVSDRQIIIAETGTR